MNFKGDTGLHEIKCPFCKKGISIFQGISREVFCNECNDVILLKDSPQLLQKLPALITEQTRLDVGSSLLYNNECYNIIGVCKFEHSEGFLYEWHLLSSGKKPSYYIEDENCYILASEQEEVPNSHLPDIKAGESYELNGRLVSVRRSGRKAKLTGIKGQLLCFYPVLDELVIISGNEDIRAVFVIYLADRCLIKKGNLVGYKDIKIE